MAELAAASPDVIILASHIPDGIAFRQAMLAGGLQVGALIGSTMAECDPDFAGELGADAIGIFASDRPTGGFQPDALAPAAAARHTTDSRRPGRAIGLDTRPSGDGGSGYGSADGYGPGRRGVRRRCRVHDLPARRGRRRAEPAEEALAGFTAAWALFHDVLPAAAATGGLDAEARRGRGAGASTCRPARCRTAPACASRRTRPRLGQNDRAAAVIWQWQAVRTYAFVWPATYATGPIALRPAAATDRRLPAAPGRA